MPRQRPRLGWWRQGVAVLNYSARPQEVDHPVFRPLMLLRDAGFEVHAVARGPDPDHADLHGVTIWVESGAAAVARRVGSLRGELVYVESSTYGLLFGRLGRRSWIRNPQLARPAVHALQRGALAAFDAVSFTNPWDMGRWRFRRDRLVDLPYPVDVEWWGEPVPRRHAWWTDRGLPVPAGPVLVCHANLVRLKRHVEMLEALAPMLRARRDAVMLFVGYEAETGVVAEILERRDALGLTDQVVLTGWLAHEDIRQLLAWTSLTVINSTSETQCMSVYEALAAGVATLIPDIPQLTSQFPGLPAHAGGAELLGNVERLLADPELGGAAVESGRGRLAWADLRRHDELFLSTVSRLVGRDLRL